MKKVIRVNKVVLKRQGCNEDFVNVLLLNGYTVTLKMLPDGDQAEIQFYQEESEHITPEDIVRSIAEEMLKDIMKESDA